MIDPGYGYILAPARRHSEPGAAGLEVFLEMTPSEKHFDPEAVLIPVCDEHGGVISLSIKHPWAGEKELQVCAGPIDLIDRKGKHLEGFTYGGTLHIEVSEHGTKLALSSPAPVLVRPFHALANLLAEETEILLAQRRASMPDEDTFERHLREAEPLTLYGACLEALQERLRRLPPDDDELMLKFKHMVKEERQMMEELLPGLHDKDLDEMI